MEDKESLGKNTHVFPIALRLFLFVKYDFWRRKLKCLIEKNEAGLAREIKFLHLLTRIDLKGIRDAFVYFSRDSSERKVTQSDF